MRTINENKLWDLLKYINNFVIENNGKYPSLNNIMDYMSMAKSTAYRYILELQKRDIVSYNGKNTLRLNNSENLEISFSRVAILGFIPCGEPNDYTENIQGYVVIPKEWVDGKCYFLQASGDSMIDIGVDDGDLVLIKVSHEAHNGQIVAVLTENGTTLKRFMYDGRSRPWLLAENNTYPDKERYLYPNKIEVQGIALKIIKDIH